MTITRDTRFEYHHTFGRKTKISPEIFENSSGEIEMSLLSLYYNASALCNERTNRLISQDCCTFEE